MTACAPSREARKGATEQLAWPGIVERWLADDRAEAEDGTTSAGVVLVCEHASNRLASPWADLGLEPALMDEHVAWDPGALGLARRLAARLARPCGGAILVHAPLSRLIFDLNRSPDRPGAMPHRSEAHDIPANLLLDPPGRLARTRALYAPFHASLLSVIAEQMALGLRPAILTVHSFTPVYAGIRREVEFGIIHDADPALALAIAELSSDSGLVTRLNEPYSAADHVTHTLRLHATPLGLPNAMLELRNDLIADEAAQAAMAERLAPLIAGALERTGSLQCRAS